MNRVFDKRRSSCLLLHALGVETHSFIPEDQRDRCNLPRQGQTCHGWPSALDEQSLVEIAEWSSGDAGLCCRTLKNIFEIVVVVLIKSTELLRFLGTLQLSFDVTVLRAGVRF